MPKPKRTDADRVILAAAGSRETGLVLPVPKSLKLSPAELESILLSLLKKGLLLEQQSLPKRGPGLVPRMARAPPWSSQS